MAKEEEKANEVAAYIDYESSSEDIEVERWTASNFENYWRSCLVSKRKVAAHPWSIKVKTLAKRMIHEFDLEDLKTMINWWVEHEVMAEVSFFERFYFKRHKVYERIHKKDYTEWEFD